MTKEEWEKQQSIVRRVYDPDTGRHRCFHIQPCIEFCQCFMCAACFRLVKGDGEIVEEIVSREQQRNINRVSELIVCVLVNVTVSFFNTASNTGRFDVISTRP